MKSNETDTRLETRGTVVRLYLRRASLATVLATVCAWGTGPAVADTGFNSGSDGSYGAMNITNDTSLDLPPNGIFNCTTITVASGATLSFNRNALNTPVYLLATNDITISGIIDVSGFAYNASPIPGRGGPGGFDGGWAGSGAGPTTRGGDGLGPGGGKGADTTKRGGAFAIPANNNTNVYGNALLVPLLGGSGGAGTDGSPGLYGGGGGGALLIASNTRITVSGTLKANGGIGSAAFAGGGSGGAIRLVSPVVAGTGSLVTSGGAASSYSGSYGRVRIDRIDRYNSRFLTITSGLYSHGAQMFVFPSVVPRLNIIAAAGQVIPEGTPNGVQIQLPAGAPTNQVVTIQARDFTNSVPIRVVVTPDNGSSAVFDATIDMSTGNPAQTNINVVLLSGTVNHIHAWTR